MALWGQDLAQLGPDKDHQEGGMMVRKEERILEVPEAVQWEAQRDTFLLALIRKAQWTALHSVGVQMAQQVERLGYSKSWNLASFEKVG